MVDNFRNKVISGTFYLGISSIIAMLSSYAVSVWLARILSPGPFGVYSLVIALMSALNIMQTTGLPQAITKQIAETPQYADAILRNGLVLQAKLTIGLTALYMAFALPIANVLHDKSIAPYILWSSSILPAYGIYALFLGYHNGLHAYKRLALANSVYSIVKFMSIILLVYPFGLYGAIGGFTVAPLVALLTCVKLPRIVHSIPSNDLIIKSFPMIGYAILTNLLLCVDIFILKASNSSTLEVGYYAAAQTIARLPYAVIGVFAYVLFPAIAKLLAGDDHKGAHHMLYENVKLVIFLLVPVTFMLAASANQITSLIYGDTYIRGAEALPALLLGGGMLTIFNIVAYVLNGAGKAGMSMTLAAISLAVSALSCFLLVRAMGMIGAAYGITFGALWAVGLATFYLNRMFRAFFPLKALAYSVLFSSLLAVPLIALKPKGIELLVSYLLIFIIYTFSLVMCKQINWPLKVRG
jgi:stage V sporulation protein B